MKNVLIIDTFSGNVAGAQKVILTLIDKFNDKANLQLIIRTSYSEHTSNLSKYNIIGYLPFEKCISKSFGQGFGFNYFSFLIVIFSFLFSIISSNLYVLYKAIRSNPDFIYTYDPRGMILSCLFLRIFGFKVVWHQHGSIDNSLLNKLFCILSSIIIVPSDAIKNNIHNKEKVKVIYNGFDFPPKSPNSQKIDRIVYVGSIVPHKGLHNVIRSLDYINDRAIRLDIYGSFNNKLNGYEEYIKKSIVNVSNKHEINLNGWTKNSVEEISKSKLFIFSSVIQEKLIINGQSVIVKSSEALPTVIIESLSVGTPVVATNTPGVSEIMLDESSGIIIEESLPNLLSKSIIQILDDIDLYTPNSEVIKKKFSEDKMLQSFCDVFTKNNLVKW